MTHPKACGRCVEKQPLRMGEGDKESIFLWWDGGMTFKNGELQAELKGWVNPLQISGC